MVLILRHTTIPTTISQNTSWKDFALPLILPHSWLIPSHSVSPVSCKASFMTLTCHCVVKYLPEWFPGAYFQRRAKAWAISASQLLDRPFTEAQSLMVHSRRQPFIILYECSSVEVGTHSKMYCNNRFGKEYRNHKGPVLYRIYHQGIPCFSIPR